jgi:hypothetical protein
MGTLKICHDRLKAVTFSTAISRKSLYLRVALSWARVKKSALGSKSSSKVNLNEQLFSRNIGCALMISFRRSSVQVNPTEKYFLIKKSWIFPGGIFFLGFEGVLLRIKRSRDRCKKMLNLFLIYFSIEKRGCSFSKLLLIVIRGSRNMFYKRTSENKIGHGWVKNTLFPIEK